MEGDWSQEAVLQAALGNQVIEGRALLGETSLRCILLVCLVFADAPVFCRLLLLALLKRDPLIIPGNY